MPQGLNVILITVDTLRADLGYAGNPKPLSPNLDELAARSVVFDRAYSLASYTGKSVGPLLIGKYPSETHRGWGHFNRSAPRTRWLPSASRRRASIRSASTRIGTSARRSARRAASTCGQRAQPPPGLRSGQ